MAAVVDEFVPPAMAEADIPGAAIALVHAGRIVYLNGFGWADVEARIAVDPERTVFRLGSLSKPVTATAVLSVLGDVSFDLDQNVVPLLDDLAFRPDRSGPITLRQLLTHMAGFNENLFDQHAANAADWLPLDVYLRRHLTPRFAPPGVAIAYTDFHTSLAGLAPVLPEIERLPNDRLRIGGGTYLETEPGLMQYEGARFYIRFAEPDSSGRAPYLFVGAGAYERIPWYESSTSTTRFGIVFGSLFLLTLAVFGWRSWRLRAAHAPEAAAGRRVVRLGLAVAGSYLLYLVAFGLSLVTTDVQYLFHGWPTTLKIALVLPLLGLLATAGLGLALAMPGARREAGRLTSLLAGLLVASSAGFLWWLHLWNMLGWRL